VDGSTALIQGVRHHLRLSIEDTSGLEFVLESLVDESRANDKAGVLQRLRVRIAGEKTVRLQFRLDIMPIDASGQGDDIQD
jgi:hypothetical protein